MVAISSLYGVQADSHEVDSVSAPVKAFKVSESLWVPNLDGFIFPHSKNEAVFAHDVFDLQGVRWYCFEFSGGSVEDLLVGRIAWDG